MSDLDFINHRAIKMRDLEMEDVVLCCNVAAIELNHPARSNDELQAIVEALFIMQRQMVANFYTAIKARERDNAAGVVTIGDKFDELAGPFGDAIIEALGTKGLK